MMSIQHERLVLFLGAGVLTEPQNQVRVLFSVQVTQLVRKLLYFRAPGLNSVCAAGVHVRGQHRRATVGPTDPKCDLGGARPVVPGHCRGMCTE